MKEIKLTIDNFDSELIGADKPVLVDFWASWCNPCRMLSPVVSAFADARDDVAVGKVNIDEEEELALRYRVMSIPTLILFKNGEAVKTSVGYIGAAELAAFVDKD